MVMRAIVAFAFLLALSVAAQRGLDQRIRVLYVEGSPRTTGLEPGAQPLLMQPKGIRHPRRVIAAVGSIEKGRTFSLGTDETWKWRKKYGADLQDGFWHNVLRYLAGQRKDPLPGYRGPFVGHVSDTEANFWLRAPEAKELGLVVSKAGKQVHPIAFASAQAKDDFCVRWHIDGLRPDTDYDYSIVTRAGKGANESTPLPGRFRTAPTPEAETVVRVAFGSCADEDDGTAKTWKEIDIARPDALVLLGDTPYIDSTKLDVQRARYRAFAAQPELAKLCSCTPTYFVWDDHDFGKDGADGTLPGKANSRRAFVEYHANPAYGTGTEGIYTSFRRGPVEVFLLDPRWFAGTEPSPFDPKKPTLLGKKQWEWLEAGLKKSTAPVKVLVSGMIFNSAVRPGKPDHWGNYEHERTGLFRMIGRHAVRGVVLVSGDIHRSRVVRHASTDTAGYDITELITSPLHHRIIDAANAPHDGLIKDMSTPNTFLVLRVDRTKPKLAVRAAFLAAGGATIFRYRVPLPANE